MNCRTSVTCLALLVLLAGCGDNRSTSPAERATRPAGRVDAAAIRANPALGLRAADPERFAPGDWRRVEFAGRRFMVAKGFRGTERVAFERDGRAIVAAGLPHCDTRHPSVVRITEGDDRESRRVAVSGDLRISAEMALVASCMQRTPVVARGSASVALRRLASG